MEDAAPGGCEDGHGGWMIRLDDSCDRKRENHARFLPKDVVERSARGSAFPCPFESGTGWLASGRVIGGTFRLVPGGSSHTFSEGCSGSL